MKEETTVDDLVLRPGGHHRLFTPERIVQVISLTVALPEGDNAVDALKRADRALADEGLQITSFSSYENPFYAPPPLVDQALVS